jgi:hypothetical protein
LKTTCKAKVKVAADLQMKAVRIAVEEASANNIA